MIYPELALRGLAFWRRTFINLFYDYSQLSQAQFLHTSILNPENIGVENLQYVGSNSEIRSVGAELFFDIRLFRLFTLRSGLRYSYPLDFNVNPNIQFIVGSVGL